MPMSMRDLPDGLALGDGVAMSQPSRASNADLAASLFRQHYLALVRYLDRRLDGNRGVAEDVAQEAITRIAAAPREYSADGARSLLYRVAGNLLIDHFRGENSRRAALANLAVIDAARTQSSPHRETIARDELRRVRAAIVALPPRCREVYVLHRFEEMSYAAISRRCGISVSMVEKHMHKALLRLADAIGRHETGE